MTELEKALDTLYEYAGKYSHLEEYFMSAYQTLHSTIQTIKDLDNATGN